MAYARWSQGNWYIWWDCDGFLACHHKKGGWSNYNHGDSVDEFVKNFPEKLSRKDEYDLRCCIKNFNEDYETEENK